MGTRAKDGVIIMNKPQTDSNAMVLVSDDGMDA
jgi:hypothetical protein